MYFVKERNGFWKIGKGRVSKSKGDKSSTAPNTPALTKKVKGSSTARRPSLSLSVDAGYDTVGAYPSDNSVPAVIPPSTIDEVGYERVGAFPSASQRTTLKPLTQEEEDVLYAKVIKPKRPNKPQTNGPDFEFIFDEKASIANIVCSESTTKKKSIKSLHSTIKDLRAEMLNVKELLRIGSSELGEKIYQTWLYLYLIYSRYALKVFKYYETDCENNRLESPQTIGDNLISDAIKATTMIQYFRIEKSYYDSCSDYVEKQKLVMAKQVPGLMSSIEEELKSEIDPFQSLMLTIEENSDNKDFLIYDIRLGLKEYETLAKTTEKSFNEALKVAKEGCPTEDRELQKIKSYFQSTKEAVLAQLNRIPPLQQNLELVFYSVYIRQMLEVNDRLRNFPALCTSNINDAGEKLRKLTLNIQRTNQIITEGEKAWTADAKAHFRRVID